MDDRKDTRSGTILVKYRLSVNLSEYVVSLKRDGLLAFRLKKKQKTVGVANKWIQSGKDIPLNKNIKMNATTAASNTRGECLEITQGETMHSKHDGKRDGAEPKTDNTSTDGGRDSGEPKHIATIKRGRNMTNDHLCMCNLWRKDWKFAITLFTKRQQ